MVLVITFYILLPITSSIGVYSLAARLVKFDLQNFLYGQCSRLILNEKKYLLLLSRMRIHIYDAVLPVTV